jgi:signal transduction histidine kinase/DNA-binding response OmpR family regulator/ligand-binding sensor domain-containing protein
MSFSVKYLWAGLMLIFAVALQTEASAANLKFNNINDLHGITMRQASSVCKDGNGFVWAATKSGILRLTDDDYRVYQLPFKTTNVLSVSLVFSHQTLWAYSNNGQLFKYEPILDKFRIVLNLNEALQNQHINVNSVLFDQSGVCWMSTTYGLYRFANEQLQLFEDKAEMVAKIHWFNSDQFFAVTLNEISLVDTKTLTRKVLYTKLLSHYFDTNSLFYDEQHKWLWLGSRSKGLFCFDLKKNEVKRMFPERFPLQPIMDLEPIGDRTILAGIDGQGVWEIDRATLQIRNVYKEDVDNPASLRGNGVYDLYHDTESDRIWVCTFSGGVSFYEQGSPLIEHVVHQVNQANSLVNNNVNDLLEDKDGNWWFATNNGISYWQENQQKWKNFYANNQDQAQVFLAVCEDNQGQIWVGSYASGVYVLDRKTGRQVAHYSQTVANSPFVNDFVFDIYKDSFGDVWIAGINSELVRFIPSDNRFQKYPPQPINMLTQYSDSIMLLGCSYGLVQLNKLTGVYTTWVDKCIVVDILLHDEHVWMGTNGEGLIAYNPRTKVVEKYTVANGLPSNYVNSVTYSGGYLWLGTENGLCRFDMDQKSVTIYSSILPMANSSFNNSARLNLRDGRLAMGSNNGVVVFDPKTIHQEQSKGKIYFQDVSILGRSIREISSFKLDRPVDELEHIKLKYNQNTLTIELLPVGIAAGSKFSWKLEGLDADWTPPSNHRLLSYNNIPNKKYVLKIRMYDNSLSQVIAERSLVVKITPPFWASWWFLIVIFLTISVLIYSVFWYYINRLKQQHTEEKVRFFTNTAHDIRTSLTLIKAPVEELSYESNLSPRGKQFLQLATDQTRRLADVVTQLMDFQKIDIGQGQLKPVMTNLIGLVRCRTEMFESLAQSAQIQLNFETNETVYETAVDFNQMEKAVDNLISNALKYSKPNTTVQIRLRCAENQWILSVKDQGIGISKTDQKRLFKEFYRGENAINSKVVGSGVGLLLVKNIVVLHGGGIHFTSEEGVGSEFILTVPYRKVDAKATLCQQVEPEELRAVEPIEDPQDYSDGDTPDKKMKIVVVEDNEELLRFLQLAFETEYDVLTAVNGIEGWELIQNELPDLVVSDVMMPKMDGFELCQLVKSTYETSHIPLILLTALTEKTRQLQGLGLGADDYLTKPFDTSLLQQRIRTIIQNRKAIREKALKLIKTDNVVPVLSNTLNDQFLKRMLEVVQENMSNTAFNRDDFASAMHVSGSLLYKKIKALTNQSPVEFIKLVRMNRALELLQARKHSITEVSELCGFINAGYFSTVFKKHFGKSPSDI